MILYACNVCGKVEPEIKGTTVIIRKGCEEDYFMLCESCVKALKLDLGYIPKAAFVAAANDSKTTR